MCSLRVSVEAVHTTALAVLEVLEQNTMKH